MILIALDEQGDFENINNELDSKPVYIGGIIYDDKGNSKDLENERKRLGEYFKSVCKKSGTSYPIDLHCKRDLSNKKNVRETKITLTKTIKEFLDNGTFDEKELFSEKRKGSYYIYCLLKGKNGKKRLLGEHISEIARDDFAANLYVHMAEEVIQRVIFNNPIIENINEIGMDLATRRVLISNDNKIKNSEFRAIGKMEEINKEHSNNGKKEYILTNPDVYRTAIERHMIENNKCDKKIAYFKVRSIYYGEDSKNQEFLYLSDVICSVLSYELDGNNSDDWIYEIENRASCFNSNETNLIFLYDENDDIYKKAWLSYEKSDYYGVLSNIFDLTLKKDKASLFYKEKWCRRLLDLLMLSEDVNALSKAIDCVKLDTWSNNLNQNKLNYIYIHLRKIAEKLKINNPKKRAILYDLYDTGLASYTHLGDGKKAKECYEKCLEYSAYIPVEQFISTRNRMVTYYCDEFEYEKGLSIANDNVFYQELILDVKKEIFGDKYKLSLNYAKCISQRGQIYAFMKESRAEEDFLKALSIMDGGIADQYITMSYLLHYYIDNNFQEKYEKISKEYFGENEGLSEQLEYLIREGKKKEAKISILFALYVYIKALYAFYLDNIKGELYRKIKKIDKKLPLELDGHPIELINKYRALILWKKGDKDDANQLVERINTSIEHEGATLKTVKYVSKISYYKLTNQKEKMELTYKQSLDILNKIQVFKEILNKGGGLSDIENKIVYMFR